MSEDYSEEKNKRIKANRMNAYEYILKQQFHLVYFGHVSYEASEAMQVSERDFMYHILIDQKAEERKQQEEAMKEAKAKKNSRGNSKPRRRR